MDVRFLRGLSTTFKAEGFAKDNKTFYYLTDTNELYLGALLLSNEITATAFAALEGRVKALEDLDLQGQIDGIKEALKSIASNETVAALDERVGALETWKNGLPEYVTKATYDAHLTTQSEKDAAQDALIAGKEEAGVAAGLVASLKTELQDAIDDVSEIAEAAQTAQEVSDAIDAKITALNLATTYEPIGAEQRAKDYSDGKLNAVVEQYLTGEGAADTIDTLNEIANWINTDEAGVAKIIADVATNTANISTVSGDLDKVEAKLNGIAEGNGTVKAAIDAVDAKFADYAKTADLGDLATKDSLTAGEVGAYTKGEVDSAITTATTDMATNASVDGKLAAYAKSEDLGDLAGKDEADLNLGQYAKTADISADIAKGVEAQGWGNHATQGYLKAADISGKEDKANLKALAYKDIAEKSDLAADVQTSLGKADTALQEHQDISHLATKAVVGEGFQDADGNPVSVTAQITANAQVCQNNFNTISQQLTWGSF